MIKKFAADTLLLLLLIGLMVVPIGMIGFLPIKYPKEKETVLSDTTFKTNDSVEASEASKTPLKSGE